MDEYHDVGCDIRQLLCTKDEMQNTLIKFHSRNYEDYTTIGLCKMFSRWIFHIFTAEIQSQ